MTLALGRGVSIDEIEELSRILHGDDDDGDPGQPVIVVDGLEIFEPKCPRCGVVLSSIERGIEWPDRSVDDDREEPICGSCDRSDRSIYC